MEKIVCKLTMNWRETSPVLIYIAHIYRSCVLRNEFSFSLSLRYAPTILCNQQAIFQTKKNLSHTRRVIKWKSRGRDNRIKNMCSHNINAHQERATIMADNSDDCYESFRSTWVWMNNELLHKSELHWFAIHCCKIIEMENLISLSEFI